MILTASLFIYFFFISAESNSQQERSCAAPFKPQVANHGEMQHVLVLFNSLGSTESALQRCAEHGSSGSFNSVSELRCTFTGGTASPARS